VASFGEILSEGPAAAMNRFNRKQDKEQE